MTLRNEIFEGIAAMKGTQEAFGGTSRDRYYDELYKAARALRPNETAGRGVVSTTSRSTSLRP